MALLLKGIVLIVAILPINCASLHFKSNAASGHRQSKATNLYSDEKLSQLGQAEPLKRTSYEMNNDGTGESEPTKPNVFFDEPMVKANSAPIGTTFENIPANYVGQNYMVNNVVNRNLQEESSMPNRASPNIAFPGSTNLQANLQSNPYFQGLFGGGVSQTIKQHSQKEDTINDVFVNAFKKYNVKKYLLQKIFGNTHEIDEDENGFFSNKHLKRHGTAGVAGKVIGELIGIKIRESIEGLGKSVSEYAKDITARNFVSLGNVFSKFLRIQ